MVRAILGTVVLMGFAGVGAHGQDTDAKLTFEVASIKPSPPPNGGRMRVGMSGGPGTPDPGRWTTENMSLDNLVTAAYGLKRYEYLGPDWMNTARFDIVAKVPEGATKEQWKVMLQNLLVERFKLTFHREKKEMQIYELVVAKNGPKLKEAVEEPMPAETAKNGGPAVGTPGAPPPPGPPGSLPRLALDKDGFPILPAGRAGTIMMNGRARTQALKQSSQQIADMLSNQIGKPVTDGTGLKGKYDFALQWTTDSMRGGMMPPPPPGAGGGAPMASTPEDSGPTIYAAVQDQLGLKLEQKKGQIEMLVVDHAEKVPTEN